MVSFTGVDVAAVAGALPRLDAGEPEDGDHWDGGTSLPGALGVFPDELVLDPDEEPLEVDGAAELGAWYVGAE